MSSYTSLSAGIIINEVLTEALGDSVTKIFPMVEDVADLPYVAYGQTDNNQVVTKQDNGSDTCYMLVAVFAETYAKTIELAELVRDALDNKGYASSEIDGYTMRRCMLTSAKDKYEGDAYVKEMTFKCTF